MIAWICLQAFMIQVGTITHVSVVFWVKSVPMHYQVALLLTKMAVFVDIFVLKQST